MSTNPHFSTSQATINNLDEVAILFDEYRVFYGQDSNLTEAKRFLFDRFEHRDSVIFITRNDHEDQAVGFVQLYPSFSSISMKRVWILNDLYVCESYRRAGVARLLLEMAKQYAIQTEAKGLVLSTAVTNEKAQKLYETSGYVKDNEFFQYYLNV